MTNDKTVTMPREMAERLIRAIDEPQPSPLYAELKSLLANHSEEPLGVVEPVTVVLPERRKPTLPGGAMTLEDLEWNACLDKGKELNHER